jgi:hypothetical protein
VNGFARYKGGASDMVNIPRLWTVADQHADRLDPTTQWLVESGHLTPVGAQILRPVHDALEESVANAREASEAVAAAFAHGRRSALGRPLIESWTPDAA